MSALSQVDVSLALTKDEYVAQLIRHQVALGQLGYQVYVQKRPVIMVFVGWDAAGKGGNIKRITEKLDPRGYVVHSIAAPAGEDKTHHYLWRFWRRLPETGEIAIFDRSWYGRILVERVEGFASETEAEFQETVDLAKQMDWHVGFVAMYSPRPGTASWRIYPDDIPHKEK